MERSQPVLGIGSHPSRVRGLKYRIAETLRRQYLSHPSRVRGLKCRTDCVWQTQAIVAPFTGAWIEINSDASSDDGISRRTLHGCVD